MVKGEGLKEHVYGPKNSAWDFSAKYPGLKKYYFK